MDTRLPFLPGLLALVILVMLSLLLSMGFGTTEIGFSQVWQCVSAQCQQPIYQTILLDIRLPRVLMGFLAGFALAGAGALMQNVTRNPLADPYLFGIVAGAGLGATLSSLLPEHLQTFSLPLAAFLGALSAVFIVMTILMNNNWRRVEHLLLAGVAVSFLLSAITSFILYFGEAFETNRVIFWMMGSLARANYDAIALIAPVILVCTFIALMFSRQLDALLLSDEGARTLGVNVAFVRILSLCVCAAMTAVVVAYCGGIGFVGLMIPHIVRPFFGFTIAKLMLCAGLVGGCFLIWVDVISRTILPGQELPIGVITSVIGSVFFLFLMRRM
ncbi:iron ABC transporter permease [Thalassotalea sp. 1_MG-2023]|uniref:FecCD family ABC transporter permease n=1 Tax=Thalassotalea sp. 1_MG-2023 TaxID=3062680 RepID=UPI0026E1C25D|nr:iron ABC transporter permease [Thalassotalea sp. 1_MG-2023]MDO6427021.1 iron ABC transporter permease [Thalassotalea sp. 1_MG-2023]